MIKWIVYWCIVNIVPTGCPGYDIREADEFGRIGSSMISCAVFHTKKELDCNHTESFTNRDSAIAFYNRALLESEGWTSWQNPGIEQVRLDSIIEQSNMMFGASSMKEITTGGPCSGVGRAYKNRKNK